MRCEGIDPREAEARRDNCLAVDQSRKHTHVRPCAVSIARAERADCSDEQLDAPSLTLSLRHSSHSALEPARRCDSCAITCRAIERPCVLRAREHVCWAGLGCVLGWAGLCARRSASQVKSVIIAATRGKSRGNSQMTCGIQSASESQFIPNSFAAPQPAIHIAKATSCELKKILLLSE